jgi:putative FmdB family regulatory protein
VPIYEYLCSGCDYKFEVKQRMSDPPIAACERCGHAVNKVISSPAIMFKGSGWYVTDYSDKLKPSSSTKTEGGAEPAAKAGEGGATASPAGGATPSSATASSPPSSSTPAASGSSGPAASNAGTSKPSTPSSS